MPLIVISPQFNDGLEVPKSSNTCCTIYINHITLQDLIEFQQCDITIKRGNKNPAVRNVNYSKSGNFLMKKDDTAVRE